MLRASVPALTLIVVDRAGNVEPYQDVLRAMLLGRAFCGKECRQRSLGDDQRFWNRDSDGRGAWNGAARPKSATASAKILSIKPTSGDSKRSPRTSYRARQLRAIPASQSVSSGALWPALDYFSPEHSCGFDRSQLHSDEGPPIGEVQVEEPFKTVLWLLRWN